ncbi:transglycosylase SLT domain-containing protein [Pseudomonas aeruginosa]|nr:transglycosylase SLT domain-containing protein [Pseudomonas aeruginosa]
MTLGLALLSSGNAAALNLKGTVWEEASNQTCKVDPRLLYAVALVESKSYAGKVVTPNPLALNISDVGHHPKNKAAAEKLLSEGLKRTNAIAVGVMQISIRWNGSRVNKPSDLLDLRKNVFVGSQILCEMVAGQNDLELAIGRYHTPNPKLEAVACGFHAIRPHSPRSSGRAFHAHLAICSTTIRTGSRSAATQGWHCYSEVPGVVNLFARLRIDSPLRLIR